ncbi:hypothetical protein CS022_12545 [Veronia nyctiphanis]|uniref:Flagellar protein FliT n=1 Tax=Veronia nyctiphanis TaxID=1278244 RepID=A0A4Q0YUW5_9GAMM|nr:hypothetical protein [Veronia nyctiphanis]RXJ72909.1 hypothetical protein CS022_12545 [Veronia nyctiphanis]
MALLSALNHIDEQLLSLLNEESLDHERLAYLLKEREGCLGDIEKAQSFTDKTVWEDAMSRSQTIFDKIKEHHSLASQLMFKLQKGRKSIQVYQRISR